MREEDSKATIVSFVKWMVIALKEGAAFVMHLLICGARTNLGSGTTIGLVREIKCVRSLTEPNKEAIVSVVQRDRQIVPIGLNLLGGG